MSLDPRSDAQLIEAHHAGDTQAFALLVERYLSSVYRFLTYLLNDPHLAEDVTQETFFKAWKQSRAFNLDRAFKPWLFAIARNHAIDQLRKQRPASFAKQEEDELPNAEETIADPRPLAPEQIANQELATLLEQALTTLPPTARTIVLLHETEELTFQQIAETLEEPLNTVKSRYRRALQRLHTLLKDKL